DSLHTAQTNVWPRSAYKVARSGTWAKGDMKAYADKKARVKASLIDIGDVVLICQCKIGKLSTPFQPRPLVIISRKGSTVTACCQDGLLHEVPVAEDHQVIDDEDTEDEREMTVPAEPPSPGQYCKRMTLPVMAEGSRKSAHPRKPTQCLLEQM
ncbi:hypothetical protein LSAT2_016534, partial [Lamellibrachia satsuma]